MRNNKSKKKHKKKQTMRRKNKPLKGHGLFLFIIPRRYAKPTPQDVIPNRAAGAVRNLLSHYVDAN
jgi:hypothetical protein